MLLLSFMAVHLGLAASTSLSAQIGRRGRMPEPERARALAGLTLREELQALLLRGLPPIRPEDPEFEGRACRPEPEGRGQ